MKDPYGNLTTFTYSGGYLQTIEDPASRLTTFTFSGGNLEAVEQADTSRTTYTYGSSGQLTQVKDPLGNVVSIVYDSAGRVGTITRPTRATEEFTAFQEQGWTNSGTSGSPAAATLFAAAAALVHRPQRQHDLGPARLVRPGHGGRDGGRARRRRHQRRQRQRPGRRSPSTRSTGSTSTPTTRTAT